MRHAEHEPGLAVRHLGEQTVALLAVAYLAYTLIPQTCSQGKLYDFVFATHRIIACGISAHGSQCMNR
jgi:class 3 adenylate cyclase